MSLSLNQIVQRIKQISLSHGQVRNFYFGNTTDFLTNKTTEYASVFVQDTGGTISTSGKENTLSVKMFFLDLVNVAADAKENELEVQSDMLSVARDIIALMNASTYTDWAVSSQANYQLVREEFDDLVAGVSVDVTIRMPWDNSYCEAPTT